MSKDHEEYLREKLMINIENEKSDVNRKSRPLSYPYNKDELKDDINKIM